MRKILGLLMTFLILGCDSKSDGMSGNHLTQENSQFTNVKYTLADGANSQMNHQNVNTISIEQLKEQLYSTDQDISGLALAKFIRMGKKATSILLEALTYPNPRTRRLAAEGLGEILDPTSAEALFKATHDSNGEVRSRAATSLYKLRDKRALTALVATLNDYPDILHNPYTASMYSLMQGGKDVLPLTIPLLRSSDVLTRQRAFLIVEAVVTKLPQGENWNHLWHTLGSYVPTAPQVEREKSAQKWQDWLTHLEI
jgi:HEAT repeats